MLFTIKVSNNILNIYHIAFSFCNQKYMVLYDIQITVKRKGSMKETAGRP